MQYILYFCRQTYFFDMRFRYIGSLVLLLSLLLTSCMSGNSSNGGELKGQRNKKRSWMENKPYGMVKVKGASFDMGMNDEDPFKGLNAETRRVSVGSFWMDETEITNDEYRQFVKWVIDSTARTMLAEVDDRFLIAEDDEGNPIDPPILNWDEDIDYADPEVQEALEELYYPPHERFDSKRKVDVRKLKYGWSDVDLLQAAFVNYNSEAGEYEGFIYDSEGNYREVEDRSDFILSSGTYIYPDTLVWIRDFTYSYNEPMAKRYFSHPGYDDYPVVGVTWKQAVAFCKWRTQLLQNSIKGTRRQDVFEVEEFRLPTEAEWELAARGKIDLGMYPWGGPYTRTSKGCFMANFKPLRGSYADDGFTETAPVGKFKANDYGLFDMAGNVAEWTSSAYSDVAYSVVHDLNPNYQYNAIEGEGDAMKMKVVRGGSWKDVKTYLQVGARTYEFQGEPRSYIGFRCVKTYIGKN